MFLELSKKKKRYKTTIKIDKINMICSYLRPTWKKMIDRESIKLILCILNVKKIQIYFHKNRKSRFFIFLWLALSFNLNPIHFLLEMNINELIYLVYTMKTQLMFRYGITRSFSLIFRMRQVSGILQFSLLLRDLGGSWNLNYLQRWQ